MAAGHFRPDRVLRLGPGYSAGRRRRGHNQRWDYLIEKLSNADISDFSDYRGKYHFEPPISSIFDTEKLWFILSFFAENSPKIPKNSPYTAIMVPPLELLRLPLSTELPYLNIPLFCFDSEFVPFVCLFFPTMLNTASFIKHWKSFFFCCRPSLRRKAKPEKRFKSKFEEEVYYDLPRTLWPKLNAKLHPNPSH